MLIQRHADAVVVQAPAKVNLFLEVLAKRPDGYHEIATLMVAVDLYDTLEFKEERSAKIDIRCDNPELGTGPENLIYQAAALLRRNRENPPGAAVMLKKRIPLAAGLAGGSSDAAATLAGLNVLWNLGLPQEELARLGAEIGSDVPFFFSTPAAWCTGRGEQVTPTPLGATLTFVLACPAAGLKTADVYRACRVPAKPKNGEEIRQAVAAGDVPAIGRSLWNRLQEAAEALQPAVVTARKRLETIGLPSTLMSGSGSAVFALCRDQEADRVIEKLDHGPEEGFSVFVVRSCT